MCDFNLVKYLKIVQLQSIFILLLVLLISCSDQQKSEITAGVNLSSMMNDDKNLGFKRATRVQKLEFPKDHAAHPEYQTEWWYVTGNLNTEAGREFGFQLTFFRRALNPEPAAIDSHWASNQLYMAHFSITDIKNQKFYSFERFSRDSLSLAGIEENPFRVWLLDWEIYSDSSDFFPLTLVASDEESKGSVGINIQLASEKPMVLQGEQGLSRKSHESDNASYYYSYSRLLADGKISINKQEFTISGDAWMDREWSTSSLDESQAGWDWFSLQLSNNEEIMFYQLRKKNGTIDLASAGTYVNALGSVAKLKNDDVEVEVTEYWKSESGVKYPSAWKLAVKSKDIDLVIKPKMQDQEINFTVKYWEGAVSIHGKVRGESVSGSGYVELSGYDNPDA